MDVPGREMKLVRWTRSNDQQVETAQEVGVAAVDPPDRPLNSADALEEASIQVGEARVRKDRKQRPAEEAGRR